jgi:hypothetical protein
VPEAVPFDEILAFLDALEVPLDAPIPHEIRDRLALLTGARYVLDGQIAELNDVVSVAPVLIDREAAPGAQELRLEYQQARVGTLLELEKALLFHMTDALDIALTPAPAASGPARQSGSWSRSRRAPARASGRSGGGPGALGRRRARPRVPAGGRGQLALGGCQTTAGSRGLARTYEAVRRAQRARSGSRRDHGGSEPGRGPGRRGRGPLAQSAGRFGDGDDPGAVAAVMDPDGAMTSAMTSAMTTWRRTFRVRAALVAAAAIAALAGAGSASAADDAGWDGTGADPAGRPAGGFASRAACDVSLAYRTWSIREGEARNFSQLSPGLLPQRTRGTSFSYLFSVAAEPRQSPGRGPAWVTDGKLGLTYFSDEVLAGLGLHPHRQSVDPREDRVARGLNDRILGFRVKRFGEGTDVEARGGYAATLGSGLGLAGAVSYVVKGSFPILGDSAGPATYEPGNELALLGTLRGRAFARDWVARRTWPPSAPTGGRARRAEKDRDRRSSG